MNVYLSHSLAEEDRTLMERLTRVGADFGLDVVAGPRPWPSLQAIAPDAAQGIDEADFVLFWLSAEGPAVPCMNLEAGYLRNTRPRLPSLIFTGRGVRPSGVLQHRPFVDFNEEDARVTIHKLWDFLHHEYRDSLQDSSGVKGLLLHLTSLLLLRHAQELGAGPREKLHEVVLRRAAVALMRDKK